MGGKTKKETQTRPHLNLQLLFIQQRNDTYNHCGRYIEAKNYARLAFNLKISVTRIIGISINKKSLEFIEIHQGGKKIRI